MTLSKTQHMKELIRKIWKDSVGGNLIAAGILGLISLIYSTFKSLTETVDFNSAMITFWTYELPLWIIITILIVALIVVKIIKNHKRFSYKDRELEFDKKLFIEIRENILPQKGTIAFLRYNNFAGISFDDKLLNDIDKFGSEKTNPNFHFFHPDLERLKNEMMANIQKFTYVIAYQTFPTPQGRQTVPADWEIEQPERFDKVVNELHSLKNNICKLYDEFIMKGIEIFKV